MTGLRAFAFGDIDAGVWGAAWLPEDAELNQVAVGAGSATGVLDARLGGDGDGDAGAWRLRLEDNAGELLLSPHGDRVPAGDAEQGTDGFDQLCRVSGTFTLDGGAHEVQCLGWRARRQQPSERDRPESLRLVAAWFEPGEGLTLLALRPRKQRGQESDLVTAAVLDAESAGPAEDPRLSTTYSDAGAPIRAGVELWLGEEDAELHSYRALGEAAGAPAGWTVGDLELQARPFRWHRGGRVGTGIYLLGTR